MSIFSHVISHFPCDLRKQNVFLCSSPISC